MLTPRATPGGPGLSSLSAPEATWTRSPNVGGTTAAACISAELRMKRFTATGFMRRNFGSNITVAPGTYKVRLHWADTPETPWMEREGDKWETGPAAHHRAHQRPNGDRKPQRVRKEVGTFHAYTRDFPGIQPQNGIIELRFKSTPPHDAMIQAVEIIPRAMRKLENTNHSNSSTSEHHMNRIQSCILLLTLSCCSVLAQLDAGNPLSGLEKLKDFKSMRASSADPNWRNGNGDCRWIKPGGSLTLADLTGPGEIVHFWCTIADQEPNYSRWLTLRIYWDGETNASVECPDRRFFWHGHGRGQAIHFTACPRQLRWPRPQLLLADALPKIGPHCRHERKQEAVRRVLLLY
jgi:hypothetical protein